jgi:sodium-dependent phosphate cotransporter
VIGRFISSGANVGTSVTNTLVAMGHFAHKEELRRGFAGATVHDIFNLLSVLVILPFQWATNFLGHLSYAMAKGADVSIIACFVTIAVSFGPIPSSCPAR